MNNLYALDPSSTESFANKLNPSQIDEDADSDSVKTRPTETDYTLEDVTSIDEADVKSVKDKPLNPSNLLATRCPLCYGGAKPNLKFSR
jgi:hypothetical protein